MSSLMRLWDSQPPDIGSLAGAGNQTDAGGGSGLAMLFAMALAKLTGGKLGGHHAHFPALQDMEQPTGMGMQGGGGFGQYGGGGFGQYGGGGFGQDGGEFSSDMPTSLSPTLEKLLASISTGGMPGDGGGNGAMPTTTPALVTNERLATTSVPAQPTSPPTATDATTPTSASTGGLDQNITIGGTTVGDNTQYGNYTTPTTDQNPQASNPMVLADKQTNLVVNTFSNPGQGGSNTPTPSATGPTVSVDGAQQGAPGTLDDEVVNDTNQAQTFDITNSSNQVVAQITEQAHQTGTFVMSDTDPNMQSARLVQSVNGQPDETGKINEFNFAASGYSADISNNDFTAS